MDLSKDELLTKYLSNAITIPSPLTIQPTKISSVDSESSEERNTGDQEASGRPVNVESSLSSSLEQSLLLASESTNAQPAGPNSQERNVQLEQLEEVKSKDRDDYEEVKSKDRDDYDVDHFSSEEQTEPVKKTSVHITSLSVLSVPDKDGSVAVTSAFKATPGTSKDSSQSSTVLITGITVYRDGNFVPLLVVHRVKHSKQNQKKQGPKKKTPMPPVDYPLEELFEVPPESYTSLDDPLFSAPWEAPIDSNSEATDFPATLQYVQSFILSEFSVSSDSGGQPEIQQIIPLDNGRLVAVTCNMSKCPPGLFGGKKGVEEDSDQTSPALSGSLFLFKVERAACVDITLLQSIPTHDLTKNIISLCPIEENQTTPSQNEKPTPKKKKEQSVLLATLLKNGVVVLYDCSMSQLTPVITFDPSSSPLDHHSAIVEADPLVSSGEEFVDCVYCPITNHLALATRAGKIIMLKLDRLQNEESGSCKDVIDGRQERQSVSDEECFKHSELWL